MQQPLVEIENLVVKYGEKTVLRGISAKIFPSEIVVLLGASGCGKTTLLKSTIGLIGAYSGTIKLFGCKLEGADSDSPQRLEMLSKIGVLFQNGALLGSLTVGENIALALQLHTKLQPQIINEIIALKLNQVNLPNSADLYPRQLSGGMKKRAALARALALDPPLLFCDEPSAGLDPVTSAGLDELLLQLRKTLGITIIVVTHELLSIERIADRIIFLHNGTVYFDGPPAVAKKQDTGPVADFFRRTTPRQNDRQPHTPSFIAETSL